MPRRTQVSELAERAARARRLREEIHGYACIEAADQLHAAMGLTVDHLGVHAVNSSKLRGASNKDKRTRINVVLTS
jgi:hypothetical protein